MSDFCSGGCRLRGDVGLSLSLCVFSVISMTTWAWLSGCLPSHLTEGQFVCCRLTGRWSLLSSPLLSYLI